MTVQNISLSQKLQMPQNTYHVRGAESLWDPFSADRSSTQSCGLFFERPEQLSCLFALPPAFHPFPVLHTDDSSIIAGHYFPMSQIVGDLTFQFYFQNRCKGMLFHTLSPDP